MKYLLSLFPSRISVIIFITVFSGFLCIFCNPCKATLSYGKQTSCIRSVYRPLGPLKNCLPYCYTRYDNLDRLVMAEYPDGSWEQFTMDIAGRRTKHEDQNGITNYHYNIGDRLLSTSGTNPSTMTWDLNGNMIAKETPDGITSYLYNSRDKLTQVVLPDDKTNEYTYYPESDLRFSTLDAEDTL